MGLLKINIDEIGNGLTLRENVSYAVFDELRAMQETGELNFEAPLEFEMELKRVDDTVMINGRLRGKVRLNCGRCLNGYSQTLNSTFSLKAVPAPQTAPRYEKEAELLHHDMDSFTYTGNVLDLREILQEQVILALPLAPVCKNDCLGLCLTCGHDLNAGNCGCEAQTGHPAFAGLKDLLK